MTASDLQVGNALIDRWLAHPENAQARHLVKPFGATDWIIGVLRYRIADPATPAEHRALLVALLLEE